MFKKVCLTEKNELKNENYTRSAFTEVETAALSDATNK